MRTDIIQGKALLLFALDVAESIGNNMSVQSAQPPCYPLSGSVTERAAIRQSIDLVSGFSFGSSASGPDSQLLKASRSAASQ